MITWIQISVALVPIIASILGLLVKMQINDKVNHLRIKNLETKVQHINGNWKQRDIILMDLIESLRKEIHQVSLQLGTMQGKQEEQDKNDAV